MPGLLATAVLTAVVVREEIPGFSSRPDSQPNAAPAPDGSIPTGAGDGTSVSRDTAASSGTAAATKSENRDSLMASGKSGESLAVPGGVPALFDRSFAIEHGGNKENWKLSLNEVSVLDDDGEKIFRLDPAATPETYEARLAAFEDMGRVLPVVYAEGKEGNEIYRRLVTEEVLLELPGNVDRVAVANSLHFSGGVEIPSYSSKMAIVKAGSPLIALSRLDDLAKNPSIAKAHLQLAMNMGKRAMPNDQLIPDQWHLKFSGGGGVVQGTDINVENVWNFPSTDPASFIRGTGVVVGIVDDGLQTDHPDLAAHVNTAIDFDFFAGDNDPYPGANDDHGTACAGDVGAIGNNTIGVSGAAPEATLVGYRLIAGPITDTQIAGSISTQNQAVHIKSNSWGPTDWMLQKTGPGPASMAALIDGATSGRNNKGVVYLWAGGNGYDYGDYSTFDGYCSNPYTIGVAAMDSLMRRSYYSEEGCNLLVTAPSSGAPPSRGKVTTDRTGAVGYDPGNYAFDFGGTSSATPTTAGIVALMLNKNPNLGFRDVQEILATTAKKINPNEIGWTTNSAGFHFHHSYGAGLVDAGAAVALAANWENLGASVSESYTTNGGPIPDRDAAGVVKTFDLSNSNVRIEHVSVFVSIDHSSRGNLEILLTSPTGVTSRLAQVHSDDASGYNFTFMTTHNWGESAKGTWTLKVADRSGSGNTTGGTLQGATLTVQGTDAPPANPGPLVQISSPVNGTIFTPGSTVTVDVTATDLDNQGNPGGVAKVELYDNGALVGTDTDAPYSFTLTPTDGPHALVAKGTDTDPTEPAVGESITVNISMENSPPVITAASIGSTPAYADAPLTVSGIVATDQDGDTPVFTYQWQKSSDGRNFTDASGFTGASVAPSAANAGLLWRCQVTPGDGEDTGIPFTTNIVNLLARPLTLTAPGSAYSYQSGLVLKSNGSEITRDAIINEFSQGPMANGVSTFSEWVEILTLRQCSLRNWSLKESSGIALTFQNSAVWDNIPAGTRIVIYRGDVTKDALLPADDANFADRQVVLSSVNSTYFLPSPGSVWPPLANSGDVITLRNGSNERVSEIGYGVASQGFINIGEVNNAQSAYYTGESDLGSNVAAQWLTTTSLVAREDITPMAAGDIFMSEYFIGSGANDRGIELYNPTSSPVNLATAGYRLQTYPNGSQTPLLNLALAGTIKPGGTFLIRKNNATFSSPDAEQTSNSADFTWSGDDTIVLRKNTVTAVDRIGQIGVDPGVGWPSTTPNTSTRGMRRNATVLTGNPDTGTPFNPASTGWTFNSSSNDYTGAGKHVTDPKFFGASATPTTFLETAGANASVGTITLASAPVADVVFTLNSSDADTVAVPATATILAGQTSITFPIAAIDDNVSDGTQNVTVDVSSPGYQTASIAFTINDDEISIVGVTPGKGNNGVNTAWIADIIAGIEDAPSVFRLGTGSVLPTGLTFNTSTGLITGTVDAGISGSFNVVIERYNADGDVTSQSFVLTIGTEVSYAAWISGFPGLSDITGEGDPESDGLKNLIEFYLGLDPSVANSGVISTERTETTLSIIFRREKGIGGITGGAQWSDDLGATWSSVGVTEVIQEDNPGDQLIKASVTITGADTKKFMRLNVTQP